MVHLKVSIITPSLNQARFLPQTLCSVREQDYPDIEHIVMDGGSTDGTLDLLRSTTGIRWVSEPDHGQADALNKGFALATGEILMWLNSDDTMNPDTVSTAVASLQRTGADVVYGDLEVVDEQGGLLRVHPGIPFDYRVLLYGIDYIGQQTTFFRRQILERAGSLRIEFDNSFDYELWLRMAAHGTFIYEPKLRAQLRYHPAAKSVARVAVTLENNRRIRDEYWDRGGWPKLFQHQPLFLIPNYWYRFKRRIQAPLLPRHLNLQKPIGPV